MIQCMIRGCGEMVSETFTEDFILKHWVIIRACQCGAWDARQMKSCTCNSPDAKVPTSYWPNLDWWMYGGVEEVVLCPVHKIEVMGEIERQRGLDPSMDSYKPNPTNRH